MTNQHFPFIKGVLLTTFFLVHTYIIAQNQIRPSSYGQWLMYFGDNKLNDKIGLHSEAQFRNYMLTNTVEQLLLRTGLNYYIGPKSMVTAGYAYVFTTPSANNVEGFTTSENRIWQQLILRHRNYNVFIEHRYRLEQRFIHNRDTDIHKYSDRIRYRFQTLLPLYNLSPTLRHLFINTYNELFLNLGSTISGQIFDRNRFYVALGYQVSPKFNLQVGYLNQIIAIPNIQQADVNHNLQLGISFNMDMFYNLFSEKLE
jgi:hypothetical protein